MGYFKSYKIFKVFQILKTGWYKFRGSVKPLFYIGVKGLTLDVRETNIMLMQTDWIKARC